MPGGHIDRIKACRTGSGSVQQAEGFVSELDKDVMERDQSNKMIPSVSHLTIEARPLRLMISERYG
jgi:hypothetical protein